MQPNYAIKAIRYLCEGIKRRCEYRREPLGTCTVFLCASERAEAEDSRVQGEAVLLSDFRLVRGSEAWKPATRKSHNDLAFPAVANGEKPISPGNTSVPSFAEGPASRVSACRPRHGSFLQLLSSTACRPTYPVIGYLISSPRRLRHSVGFRPLRGYRSPVLECSLHCGRPILPLHQ